jgi:preprotein translocase subunit SecA
VRLFAGDRIKRIMERFKIPEDQPMEAKILSGQIEGAQKKVEEQNFVARKNVLKYDDVMNRQRMVIYEQRRQVLEGEDMSEEVRNWIDEVVERTVNDFTQEEYAEEWDLEALVKQMATLYDTEVTVDELKEDLGEVTRQSLIEEFQEDARDSYAAKEEELTPELMRELERFVILQVVDQRWREHLDAMDYLREGVHLRAMAQKDPLVEYQHEGHIMFTELGAGIHEEVVLTLFHAQLAPEEADELQRAQQAAAVNGGGLQYAHESLAGADAILAAGGGVSAAGATATLAMSGGGSTSTAGAPRPIVKSERENIGRNDPCWCGSGKKFK